MYNQPIFAFLEEWNAKDPKAATDWVMQIRDEQIKQQLAPHVLIHGSQSESLDRAEKMGPQVLAATAREIMLNWPNQDQKAATDWALKNENPMVRNTALKEIAFSLTLRGIGRDINLSKSWINTLDGQNYDVAAPVISGAFASEAPNDAVAIVSKIDAPELRKIAAENVARTWLNKNHDEAAAWIENSPLFDEKTRQQLLAH
jgi:hypothetical protein